MRRILFKILRDIARPMRIFVTLDLHSIVPLKGQSRKIFYLWFLQQTAFPAPIRGNLKRFQLPFLLQIFTEISKFEIDSFIAACRESKEQHTMRSKDHKEKIDFKKLLFAVVNWPNSELYRAFFCIMHYLDLSATS